MRLGEVRVLPCSSSPAAECIEVGREKAIIGNPCLIESTQPQTRNLPNMLLFTSLVRMSGLNVATREWDRGSQELHSPNACLNVIFNPLRSLGRKKSMKGSWCRWTIRARAGSNQGLFVDLISLAGCICGRVSSKMAGLHEWGREKRKAKGRKAKSSDKVHLNESLCYFVTWSSPPRYAIGMFTLC